MDNNNKYTIGIQEDGTESGSDHSESEAEMPAPVTKPGTSMLVNSMIPRIKTSLIFSYQLTGLPFNLLQTFLAQTSSPALATLQVQPSATVSQPQNKQVGMSKGIKGYPDGWHQVLKGHCAIFNFAQ